MSKRYKIVVCRGPDCGDVRGSRVLMDEFVVQRDAQSLEGCTFSWQSCFGRCRQGPNVLVTQLRSKRPEAEAPSFVIATPPPKKGRRATMYNRVTVEDVGTIVAEHLIAHRPVRRLIHKPQLNEPQGTPKTPLAVQGKGESEA